MAGTSAKAISALLASHTGGCQLAKPRSSRRTSMLAVRLLPIALIAYWTTQNPISMLRRHGWYRG